MGNGLEAFRRGRLRRSVQLPGLDSPLRNPLSGQGKATHQETLSHALPTLHTEDQDLALIVGLWDRLADQIKTRLIDIIKENVPSEDWPAPPMVRALTGPSDERRDLGYPTGNS